MGEHASTTTKLRRLPCFNSSTSSPSVIPTSKQKRRAPDHDAIGLRRSIVYPATSLGAPIMDSLNVVGVAAECDWSTMGRYTRTTTLRGCIIRKESGLRKARDLAAEPGMCLGHLVLCVIILGGR
jgi:hypothetical protein